MSVSNLIKRLEAFATKAVYVGVPKENNPKVDGDFSMSDLAAVHEFGSEDGHIPERSFLRTSVVKNKAKYFRFFGDRLITGNDPEKALNELAELAKGDVQENIVNGDFKALAPETIKRKGSTKPLIDTGKLRQSITGVVRDEN
ncbi:hypothetical protein V757_01085 [Pelistega indica]|uniref:Uncharacterized protein n=1 Tax=Pelistega indica TaxID=1414851 RepID=V8GB59_9BURK|nr:hypothetical protein [Pelistega indica]ETD72967.1 hypothetical protein V757_01085 [Pelistega indica]